MQKLNKKQREILSAIHKSMRTAYGALNDFFEEGNYKMVSHMQDEIQKELSGVVGFLIYYDLDTYNALEERIDEMRKNKKLHWKYAWELL